MFVVYLHLTSHIVLSMFTHVLEKIFIDPMQEKCDITAEENKNRSINENKN